MAIRPPWAMFAIIERERLGASGHLEADVEALRHPELALHVGEVALARVDRERCPHPARQVETVGIEIGDDDMPGAGVPDDGGRHAADRARARDEHVLAEHGERSAVCTAFPNGSKIEATSSSTPAQWCQMFVIGSETSSANAPGRFTPSPIECAHRCRRPAMQLRQRPQTTWPSPLTRSPAEKSLTFDPNPTTSPTNS